MRTLDLTHPDALEALRLAVEADLSFLDGATPSEGKKGYTARPSALSFDDDDPAIGSLGIALDASRNASLDDGEDDWASVLLRLEEQLYTAQPAR